MSKKVESAKAILEAEEKRINELCAKEIEAVLKKHNRQMIVSGQFHGSQIKYNINILPL